LGRKLHSLPLDAFFQSGSSPGKQTQTADPETRITHLTVPMPFDLDYHIDYSKGETVDPTKC
jgi:hypothetical protein